MSIQTMVDEKENNYSTKQQRDNGRVGAKQLGNKNQFDLKMKEIANNEDFDWIY